MYPTRQMNESTRAVFATVALTAWFASACNDPQVASTTASTTASTITTASTSAQSNTTDFEQPTTTAFDPGANVTDTDAGASTGDPPAESSDETVFIQVQNLEGDRIPGAVVVHRRKSYLSTDLGQVLIDDPMVDPDDPQHLFVASVHAKGYATANVALLVPDEGQIGHVVTLLRRSPTITFNAGDGAIIKHETVHARIRPNSLIDASGNYVTGPVDATVTVYDPDLHGFGALPGPLIARNMDGEIRNLETAGMAEVTLTQDGHPLQIAPGHTARLEILLPPVALERAKVGDSIDAWWLNEGQSLWMQDGTGLVQKSEHFPNKVAWVAEVSHFTWWNIDWPWETSRCFDVILTDSQGKPRKGVQGTAMLGGFALGPAYSSESGGFCVEMPLGLSMSLILGNPQSPLAEPIELNPDINDPPSNCAVSLGTAFGKPFVPQPPGLVCEQIVVKIYENAACVPGDYKTCGSYPEEYKDQLGVGVCQQARQYCNAYGTDWDPCSEHIVPTMEICDSDIALDDDCNGKVDDANCPGCNWILPEVKPCYPGPESEIGVGMCQAGQQICVDDGNLKGMWGECGKGQDVPLVTPTAEDCSDDLDQNCDGQKICMGHGRIALNFGSPEYGHFGHSVAVDSDNNTYIAGQFLGDTESYSQNAPVLGSFDLKDPDILVAKVQNGVAQADWVRRIGGSGTQKAEKILVDDNSIHVVGTFDGILQADEFEINKCGPLVSNGGKDVFIARYNLLGSCQWRRNFGTLGDQQPLAAAVDYAKNLVITGSFTTSLEFAGNCPKIDAKGTDAFVAKLASDATGLKCLWAKGYGDHELQEGTAIAVDGANNVWLGGNFLGVVQFGNNALVANDGYKEIFLAKLAGASGVPLNARMFGGGAAALTAIAAVPKNPDNDLSFVLTGTFNSAIHLGGAQLTSNGNADIFIGKFDSNGVHQWSHGFGGQNVEIPEDVAVDVNRNIVLVGAHHSPFSINAGMVPHEAMDGFNAFVLKFDTSGKTWWSRSIGSSEDQFANGVAIDLLGFTHVVGQFRGVMDFSIEEYDPNMGKKTLVNLKPVHELFAAIIEP